MKTGLKLIGGEKIESPKSELTRPTTMIVREAVFNILKKNVENSLWLDLFSGSGAISCEAFNHGAKRIVAVEKDKKNAALCKRNLFSLRDSNNRKDDIEVINKDVFNWINLINKRNQNYDNNEINDYKFDYIYLDPPYKNEFNNKLLEQLFTSNLLKQNTLVIYEHSKFNKITGNILWKIKDTRLYGQTKLTFLIKI